MDAGENSCGGRPKRGASLQVFGMTGMVIHQIGKGVQEVCVEQGLVVILRGVCGRGRKSSLEKARNSARRMWTIEWLGSNNQRMLRAYLR